MTPADIIANEDYRLRMRFDQRPVADFYRPTADHSTLIKERKHWLSYSPGICSALLPEGEPLLEETVRMAADLMTLPADASVSCFQAAPPAGRCRWLGERWEPDFLLMKPDSDGLYRLVGGALCFPSHWDLRGKMGRTMAEIHGPIPGLNEQLGRQIDGFLQRIKPGISWERVNWGLSRSPERNTHPSRSLPRLDENVNIDEVWWRIEEQSLVALPESGGILFGIRIALKPFSEVRDNPIASERMVRALHTMPGPMADYKGLAAARERLITLLET